MSRIMKFIDGYTEGNAWEDLIVQCYRLRYQGDHYTSIPAAHGGDAGIEGFTHSGIVHQSYGPERSYSDNDHYEHLRDKLTADITKLMGNAKKLLKLGVPPVTEWHFNIPEYRDSRIISHAQTKQQAVLDAKKNNPSDYVHISDGFRIIIKTAEDFAPEIYRLVRTNLTDMKINLTIQQDDAPDWEKCDSEKVENIRRKIKAVMLVQDDSNAQLNRVVKIFIEYYMRGIENMTRLRSEFADVYESILQLEQSYKGEVSLKTNMNMEQTLNQKIFYDILGEFQAKLEQEFSQMFNAASITELKHDLVAKWLADCDMEFRSAGDGQ